MPYWVSISARTLPSWMIDSTSPLSTSKPDQRHRDGRKLLEHARQVVVAPMRHGRQRRQRADPVGHGDAVQEQRRPGQPLRRGGRGMPAGRQRQPDARHRERGQHPGDQDARAFPRVPGDGHRHDRNQQRRPEAGGKRARPRRRRHDAAKRKVEEIETLQAERGHRADETDGERAAADRRSARALPDPGREERAADADEQAEIDPDPRQPDQHRQRAGFRRRRGPGHGADREHHRSRHGMAVLRDHAVADDLRALRQVVGQNDQHGLADRARGDVARLAAGIDDADHGRRDALVEVQLHHLRRQRQHAAIGRLRRNQRRMGPRGARNAQSRQQRGKASEHARHRDGFTALRSA